MHEEAMAPLLAKNTTGAFLPNDFSNRVVGLWAWKINGTTWVELIGKPYFRVFVFVNYLFRSRFTTI